MYATIAAIRAANRAAGQHWFDPDTMRFFGSRIASKAPINGRYFITSECPPSGTRAYTIRLANPDGSIDTIGEFCGHPTRVAAEHALCNYLPTPTG